MKFIVAVDCEGVAGAVGAPGGILNSSPDWEFARVQATREADAAARGLFAGGADRVIVWDNTADGVMAHSFSSATYQWMKIDGREVGEIEQTATRLDPFTVRWELQRLSDYF